MIIHGEVMSNKVYNFSAGPAVLPKIVTQQLSEAAINYNGHGLSILEMSHRSKPISSMVEETTELVKEILNVPENYDICWLQGGASTQFSMIPMNFISKTDTVDYADTGAWSAKAIKEAQRFGRVNITSSSKDSVYSYIPKEIQQDSSSIYLHITSNNTIYGTQYKVFPNVINPNGFLIADMSSDIFSRVIDVNKFGIIYAGAQKNMGPAGVTMVIIRHDLLDRINDNIPAMLDYRVHVSKGSMFNTPPVYAIYAVNRTLHWLKDMGGLSVIEEKNIRKSDLLYNEIERNLCFKSPVATEDRSTMNIPFLFDDTGDDAHFLNYCQDRGLLTLKGHRSVGGFRASIYNAMPEEGIRALIDAMQSYEKGKYVK